ncbi:MAG: DUF1289 domain-containing protein [Novosphingobium meiothermophilum]|uniref:DUF1289 domain-containing protein n=1 Tax=Novosphingobium TaxID=165696 RepID=UPI000D6E0F97|nr:MULTISPECIES: DUF1289 domain-containing protein [Novosphingobium]
MPAPASPCTGVCRIAPHDGLCAGCARTIGEISEWPAASAARKRAILAAVARRQSERMRST